MYVVTGLSISILHKYPFHSHHPTNLGRFSFHIQMFQIPEAEVISATNCMRLYAELTQTNPDSRGKPGRFASICLDLVCHCIQSQSGINGRQSVGWWE